MMRQNSMFLAVIAIVLAAATSHVSARAEGPSVVVDIPAVQSLVRQVMGDKGDITVLVGVDGDAHNFQLRPSDSLAVRRADLMIWVGPALTPQLAHAIEFNLSPGAVNLNLSAIEEIYLLPADGDDHNHGDHNFGDHKQAELHEIDPHFWLSPRNAIAIVKAIARELSARNPLDAADYGNNAKQTIADITELERQMKTQLADYDQLPIILSHDFLKYFEHDFDVNFLASMSASDASATLPRAMLQVLELIDRRQANCVFVEFGEGQTAQSDMLIANGLTAFEIDPTGVEHRASGRVDAIYKNLMTDIVTAIQSCS